MRLAWLAPAITSGMAPPAISLMVGSTLRMALANRLCLSSNCSADMGPICQSPHGSLPTPQNFTLYGCGWPLAARHLPIGVVAAPLTYSTSSRRRPRVAEAGIDGDVGLDVEQAAERDELIRADVVGLHRVPDRIEDRRALVEIADRVAPLVGGDEVAAGEAENAGVQLLQRGDDLGAKALDVVGRHQRDRADVERSVPVPAISMRASSVSALARNLNGKLAIGGGKRRKRTVWRSAASLPQIRRHLHDRAGRAGQHDASGVRFPFAHSNARLARCRAASFASSFTSGVWSPV